MRQPLYIIHDLRLGHFDLVKRSTNAREFAETCLGDDDKGSQGYWRALAAKRLNKAAEYRLTLAAAKSS